MPEGMLLLEPGTLWKQVLERTEHALRCGALQSLPTEHEFVEQEDINFFVRVLVNLARKEASSAAERNPFLPYEEALFVAEVSDTHVCLLNKFNVVDHHLLIITRAFEDQEALLTLQDFAALWACMSEIEGLAFYNAGKIAGASQRHKHLQLVPLPLAPEGPGIPIEPALTPTRLQDGVEIATGLPFRHALTRLNPLRMRSPWQAADTLLKNYRTMLRAVAPESGSAGRTSPYNLLATRQWMLLAPRSQECFQSIPVNSLGFAGALLVKNHQQLQLVKAHGPMTVLKSVAQPLPKLEV